MLLFMMSFFKLLYGPGLPNMPFMPRLAADEGGGGGGSSGDSGGASGSAGAGGAGSGDSGNNSASDELAQAVTELADVYRAYPDVVPGMIRGNTIAELKASLASSRTEYAALAAKLVPANQSANNPPPAGQSAPPATPPATPPPPVGAGGGERRAGGPGQANRFGALPGEQLSPVDKIKLGLEQRGQSR
jgi:hypothetical protein